MTSVSGRSSWSSRRAALALGLVLGVEVLAVGDADDVAFLRYHSPFDWRMTSSAWRHGTLVSFTVTLPVHVVGHDDVDVARLRDEAHEVVDVRLDDVELDALVAHAGRPLLRRRSAP